MYYLGKRSLPTSSLCCKYEYNEWLCEFFFCLLSSFHLGYFSLQRDPEGLFLSQLIFFFFEAPQRQLLTHIDFRKKAIPVHSQNKNQV